MDILRTVSEGETFTHRVLWICCKKQMETAEAAERGSFYYYLTAMLMAYFTYEAYLNFAGDLVAPDLWTNERANFSNTGTEGKLFAILDACRLPHPPADKGAYQTIKMLESFRNDVAHGKRAPHRVDRQHRADKVLVKELIPASPIKKQVSKQKATKAIRHVEEFIEWVHGGVARSANIPNFTQLALKGPSAFSAGHSEMAT